MVMDRKNELQNVFINMDDSGVLHRNDKYCVYGGIVFTDKKEMDAFRRKYKKALSQINCKYCRENRENCKHNCPEIKDSNIKGNHKRWLFNMIKKEQAFAVIIDNAMVNDSIMMSKSSRGRYRDYAQRLIIRRVIAYLIKEGRICPDLPVNLVIRIDQQATTTDVDRKFVMDIERELVVGMKNFDYNMKHKPILFADIDIDLKYVVSSTNTLIQASDFIAGETRRAILNSGDSNEINYLDVKLFLP